MKGTLLGWIAVGVLAVGTAVAAWMIIPPGNTAPARGQEISADRGGLAAGHDVVVGHDLVVKEYDLDERARRERNAFAAGFGRECRKYLELAKNASLEKTEGTRGVDALTLGVGGGYFVSDVDRVLGEQVYRTVNEQMNAIGKARDALFQLRMRHGMAAAMNQQNAALGKPLTDVASIEREFDAGKTSLIGLTRTHCEYLDSLKSD